MSSDVILPGATIGIFGSGQLGRMIAVAAKRMGYRVVVFSPEENSPAGQVCDQEIVASYEDQSSVESFAKACDVITLEFENIPAATVRWANELAPVHPGDSVLSVAQNRIKEKETLRGSGIPVTPFQPVRSREDLALAIDQLGLPIVLKTAGGGYDGKGQRIIRDAQQADAAFAELSGELIAEQMIQFQREVSILVYRDKAGNLGTFPLIENHHENHILDVSICPAPQSESLFESAVEIAYNTADCLQLIGLLCIEMFVCEEDGLLVNEIAPRPHNSGHLTIESFPCCQFQQLVRAVCGLPFGSTQQRAAAAMVILLGDQWQDNEPSFDNALAVKEASLHLYGKSTPKLGRKMGHITATADTVELARENALAARSALR